MLEKIKADILFHKLLKRPDIGKAYAMVGPEDSWYDTIRAVHHSLEEIRKLPHETLEITSHDGLKLNAVYYPCESDRTAIWVHGYTSHAERESAFPALFYRSLGCNVLIPYLRAHGPSEGRYISFGALEHLDIMRWVERINEMIPDGQIILHGLSMGGGIVLDLADKEMKNVKCIISDAPSVSILDFFRNVTLNAFKTGQEKIAAYACKRFKKEFSVDASCFERLETVKHGRYPILATAGSNEQMDDILLTIQKNNPMETEILILPGCDHGNGMYKQTEMYQNAIKAFVGRYWNAAK
ncbi:MAG: alpha/beta hydrolase [Faecousia sp.]